jgi:hypothetical protein
MFTSVTTHPAGRGSFGKNRLALTYMGPDVQAYLDAKYKGTLPDDWNELEQALKLRYMLFDHKVRIELRLDALQQRSSL